MTREEAIAKMRSATPGAAASGAATQANYENFVNCLVALGMLKLDEPKSAKQKFNDAAVKYVNPDRWIEFLSEIDRFGLKIIEK